MHRSTRAAGSGALIAAAAAAAALAPTASATSFFTPPASLPAENGAIVRAQAISIAPTLAAKATRIMYKTTDSNGAPTGVTGTYLEPTKKWTGVGPRPLITFSAGTQGQGDGCAPTFGFQALAGGKPGTLNIGYEQTSVAGLLNRGFAVVATDYIGLGTDNRVHTYVNRVDEARAVLDAARAAPKVAGASVTAASPVGTYGYSQGGGASAAAAELQPIYAPELNLKGGYAGAPPANLLDVMKKADGTSLTAVIGYAINGFIETYPALRTILERETNAAGKAALKKISTQCIGDSIGAFGYSKTNKWTTSGKSAAAVVESIPEALAIVDEQKIGKLKPSVPVRVVTGTKDDIVPHLQAKRLAGDWCAQGAVVDYVPVKQDVDSFGTALNHLGPSVILQEQAQAWIAARLAGTPTKGNCGSLNQLP